MSKRTRFIALLLCVVMILGLMPTIALAEEPDKGLVLQYDFKSLANGTIVEDISGNGKAAEVMPRGSGVQTQEVEIYGQPKTAIVIAGGAPAEGHNYVELPVGVLNDLESVTISCWAYVNRTVSYGRIWDFGSNTTSYMYLLDGGGNTGHRGYTTAITGSGWSNEIGPQKGSNLATRTWKLTTVTFDGATREISLYEDGEKIGTSTAAVDLSRLQGSTQNWIGYGQFKDNLFNGMIADFRIYNYAMSDAEVAALFDIPDEDRVQRDYNSLSLGNTQNLESNLRLPANGSAGSSIEWTSSDPDVITAEGVITRPAPGQENAAATLTARIYYGEAEMEKTFDVTVQAMPTDEERVAYDAAAINLGSLNAVIDDLRLPTVGEKESTITWTSSDPAHLSNDGKVTRPIGEPVTVKLTAVISYGEASETREFDVTILPVYEKLDAVKTEQVAVTTKAGIAPALPAMVLTTFEDGSKRMVKASWPTGLSGANFAEVGEYDVTGTLVDFGLQVSAKVSVVEELESPDAEAKLLKLADVTLDGDDTIYGQNMGRALAYLKIMDADRMLYNFRRTFGQDTKGAQALSGWDEPTGLLRGHSTGHFMSALAEAYASTGDEAYKEKLDYMIDSMRELQLLSKGKASEFVTACSPSDAAQSKWSTDPETWGEGFISAYSPDQFALLEQYTPYATIWAPYYTMHKLLAGFLDSYVYAGNETGLEIAKDLGLWVYDRLSACTPEQRTRMWSMYIAGEYGGMNEVLARLYEITGDERLLTASRMFDNTTFFNGLAKNEDTIQGRHANQHIPQIVGAIHEYAATGDPYYYNVAHNFWEMATARYAYSIGGVGTGESFKQPYRQGNNITGNSSRGENCETCAAYNMLKLTRDIYVYDPDNAEYMDYYERTVLNQIAASQSHNTTNSMHNGCTYMLPIDPGQRKTYDSDYGGFTCCNGTGMENHVIYQIAAYATKDDTFYVNLFMPSTANWEEKGVTVKQETKFPSEDSKLTVTGSGSFKMKIRVPYWATAGFEVKVNGETVCTAPEPSSYVEIDRAWADGDVVDIHMPYTLHLDKTPDKVNGSLVASLMYGPIVMVARDNRSRYTAMNWYNLSLNDTNLEDVVSIEEPAGTGNVPHLVVEGLDFYPMYDAYNYRYHAYVKLMDAESVLNPEYLQAAVDAVTGENALTEANFDGEDWTAFQEALAAAEALLEKVPDVTQEELYDAQVALEEAAAKAHEPTEPEDPEVPVVDIEHPELPIWENTEYTFAERAADLIARMSVAQKGSQLVSTASAISASALGGGALSVPATKSIPSYEWWSEALHGYSRGNTSGAVIYPQNLTMASTWNPELYYRQAVEIGNEIREKTQTNSETGNAKNLNFYSPTVNMHRDPRWGRNEESFSEDVYLTGKMASEFVLGMEGKDREGNLLDPDGYLKAMCTVKHYVANNSERNRLNGGATSDLRALREYYAAPYRNVIQQADVRSVMTAYSTFNGEPSSYSSYLMDTLLRQTYGFNGHITSDCDSVATQNRLAYVNPYTGATMTDLEALAGSLAHGEDLECNGGYSGFGTYSSKLARMIDAAPETDKGIFTENAADVGLLHMFTDRIATGEFDENLAYTAAAAERIANGQSGQSAERLAIIDEVNREGVVLLKNNGVLPLQISEGAYNVVIVGSWQTQTYTGLYSAGVSGNSNVNIQKGITDAIKAVNADATFTYITSDTLTDENKAAIEAADAVVVVVGTNSNYSKEDGDRSTIALPNGLDTLISSVGQLNAKTIAVMETCGAMQVKTFEDDVAALLWSSYGGLRKGVGFGDIITGAVNPSGKLTDTWYQDVNDDTSKESDIPSIYDYNLYATDGSNGRTYMYYKGEKAPSYPFGYGLSYTTYEYSNLKIDKTAYDANDTVKVSFDVKNTGSVAGKEITQLYIAQPDAPAELNRPIRRLEGFDKIELQPGETKTVEMEVAIPDLAFFDETDKRFEVDTGAYQVQVGKDSASANLTADFTVSGEMDVYPVLLTVKANQVGDTEQGIEERVIFDKGATINPQLTMAMNDESLYGYVIAHQKSPIDQVASSELPAGTKVGFKSNRPSVVSVGEDGTIKAVNAGVATITAFAKYKGRMVTAEFVVYVEANPYLDSITLNGEPMEGFNREKFGYELNAADYESAPVVGYVSNTEGLAITVEQFPGIPGVATITSVDEASGATAVYRIGIGNPPVSTDFSEGWAKAQEKGWTVKGENEVTGFGEDGLTLSAEETNFYSEPAFGEWAAQTKVTLPEALSANGQQAGLIVKDTDNTYVKLVYEQVTSTGWWARTNYYVTAYSVVNGEQAQVARSGNLGTQTEMNLRVIKSGGAYTFAYSVDGENWTEMNGNAKVGMADPKIGPFVSGIAATFDGINVCKVSELYPRLASVKLNGSVLTEFDPEVFIYNFVTTEDAAAPVFEATGADETIKVEITQLDTATGEAKIRAYNDVTEAVYKFYFDLAPVSDYLADGAIGDRWTIERENPEVYSIEKGKGLVLPTQQGDIHGTGGAWENCFNMPAQGNWQAVAKIVYPNVPTANYQQAMFLVWQDENNYLRMNCQTSNLTMEPGIETNGSFNGNLGNGQALAAEDGTVTLYFMIDKAGDDYTVGYSQDGVNFTKLRTASAKFANPRIGLFATQNSSSAQMNMYYEYVAVTWLNGVEQMTYPQMNEWAAQNVADYIAADLPDETSTDLVLSPAPHGYAITLESANPAVIDAEGKVTQPEFDTNVKVTVKAADANAEATAEKTIKVKGNNGAPAVDKTALNEAVAAAEAVDKTKYTDESVAALEAALANAKTVQAAGDADQAAVDAAAAALNAAIAALEEKPEPQPTEEWVLVDEIVPGEPYVIVADNAFAMNNTEVPGLAQYATGNTTRGATAVAIDGDRITSAVDESMQWIFVDAADQMTAYDGQPVYFLTDLSGKYLQRGSMSRQNSGLILNEALNSNMRYNTWSMKAFEDAEGGYCLYINSERAYGNDYAARVQGSAAGFDIPSPLSQRDAADPFAFMNSENTSRIRFYGKAASAGLEDIDFTDPADADKFEIIAQADSQQVEGEGVALVTSMTAVEPAGTHWQTGEPMLSGDAANTPKDLVEVPVEGDWTATLTVDFDTNGAANGYYQFFGFFASEGDDYQKMAGIRGGDGTMQDFVRVGDAITADSMGSAPGFATVGTYVLRIEKEGDDYTCYRSEDGVEFTEMFKLEDTGVEATKIVIDAYSGMTEGYKFTLKSLKFSEEAVPPVPVDRTALEQAIAAAEAVDKDLYTDETVAALDEALAAAKAVPEDADQAAVDAAAEALNAAIAALEAKPTVDKTALEAAIAAAEAEAEHEDVYTAESLAALNEALAAAKAVEENPDATQAEVDAAAAALNEAVEALEVNDIHAYLEKLANEAKALAEEAKAAAEAAKQAAAEAAQSAAADKEAAEAAKAAAEAAQQKAEAAQKAAEDAQAAAEAADADAAAQAAEAAKQAAEAAKQAAEAAKAQAAAQAAQEKAEAAQKAAEAAQKAAEDAQKAAAEDKAAADAAKEAAEAAQKLAEAAQKAAEAAKQAADASNAAAAEAAKQAAADAAKVAEALKEAAELVAQAAEDRAAAEKAKEAAQKAALDAEKTNAKTLAALAAMGVDPDALSDEDLEKLDKIMEDAMAAIDAAEDSEAVQKALDDAIAAIEELGGEEPWLFDDVKDDTKFYFDPVYWAYYADPQITNGKTATTFGPDDPCTRGHVVTFLWRAAGCPEPKSAETPFTDLKPGAFYEKAVAWAVEEGITNGKSATTFAPDDPCNRGQIVTFLWRFAGEEEPEKAETPFTDLKAGAFYETAVAWAVENEITNGMTATTFGPDATCTRGQVVTFLYRATAE